MADNFNTRITEDNTSDWLTPKWLIDMLGEFDLDPCASKNRNFDIAKTNYTIDDDGLSKEWEGRVFLNPPYGRDLPKWLKKMAGSGCTGLALIFARTDTKAFHDYVFKHSDAILFIKGRIKFEKHGMKKNQTSNAPSCLVAYGKQEMYKLIELRDKGLGEVMFF